MRDQDDDIRRGLERLTEPDDPNRVVTRQGLASRRGRQREAHTAFIVVPIVVVALVVIVTLAVTARVRDQPDATAEQDNADPPTASIASPLNVKSIEVTGAGATSRVELRFDSPLPDIAVKFVESLRSVEAADGIIYTVQPASEVNVCDSVHSFPPPADGTVDVLVPASWFAQVDEPNIGPIKQIGRPAKFVPCGPYEGFYQYSIWGPASIEPSQISVKIENGTNLVVSIVP